MLYQVFASLYLILERNYYYEICIKKGSRNYNKVIITTKTVIIRAELS